MSASFAEPQLNSGCVYPLWAGENSLAFISERGTSKISASAIKWNWTTGRNAVCSSGSNIFPLHGSEHVRMCKRNWSPYIYAQAVLCIPFGWLGFVKVHLSGSREHLRGTEVVVILCARALLSSLVSQLLRSTWMNWALWMSWRKGAAFEFLRTLPQLHSLQTPIISSTNISILFLIISLSPG